MNIEGLSIHVLAAELDQKLSGGRIEKILQPTRYLFVLKIRQPDRDYSLAISVDPGDPRAHLTQESRENPPEPSALCMLLRKHLTDGRIAAVQQQEGLDRVLHFQVDIRAGLGKIDTKTLTVELAGKNCNLILSRDGMIIDSARRVGHNTSRIREIVPGVPYVPPPDRPRLDPLASPPSEILDTIRQLSLPLAKSLLAAVAGLGPFGISELLHRAGLKGSQPAALLNEDESVRFTAAFQSFMAPHFTIPAPAHVAMDSAGHLLGVSIVEPTHLPGAITRCFPSLDTALEYAATLMPAPRTTLHQDTLKRVRTELEKLERKMVLLSQELTESRNADEYRRSADLLMGSLHLMTTGQSTVKVPDYFALSDSDAEIPPIVEIHVEPALSPMANVQRYYKKYSRAKRAQDLIQQQLDQCREDMRYLESIALALSESVTRLELTEIIQELVEAGYVKSSGKVRTSAKPSEPRKIVLDTGSVLYIGKNNRQNDIVTFKIARAHDLWFHTKDIPGSHVVLKSSSDGPLAGDMEMAAHFAAWFSKARESSSVPVDFTERRHVRKPSGAKPGFVIYDRQKTIRVTPDASVVAALMEGPVRSPSPE